MSFNSDIYLVVKSSTKLALADSGLTDLTDFSINGLSGWFLLVIYIEYDLGIIHIYSSEKLIKTYLYEQYPNPVDLAPLSSLFNAKMKELKVYSSDILTKGGFFNSD